MIKLAELFNHIINSEEEEGLVPVDNWKATHTMYVEDMGFKNDGMFHYSLKKPEMRLKYKKKVGFVIEDKTKKETHSFRKFKELEEYFANYKQKWDHRPYN